MTGRPSILILTAIRAESAAIIRATAGSPSGNGLLPGTTGWTVMQREVGMKAKGLPSVEVPAKCRLIMMAGLAGGLDPSLSIGDVIVSDVPLWLQIPSGIARREISTSTTPIATPTAKAERFARTGAAVVDMETAIVRQWARAQGIDFVAIRAISDAADDAIDPKVMELVDSYGRPRPVNIAAYLLSNPLRIRQLIELGRSSKQAARNLGIAVRDIVELLPPEQ